MDDQALPSAQTTPSAVEGPDEGRVVEWFRADTSPFGPEIRIAPDPVDGSLGLADPAASAVIDRARAIIAAVEQALRDPETGPSHRATTEIDRIVLGISQLERERDSLDVALASLKRRQRRQVS